MKIKYPGTPFEERTFSETVYNVAAKGAELVGRIVQEKLEALAVQNQGFSFDVKSMQQERGKFGEVNYLFTFKKSK